MTLRLVEKHANRIPIPKGSSWETNYEAARADGARAAELGGEYLAAYRRWEKYRFFVDRRRARG